MTSTPPEPRRPLRGQRAIVTGGNTGIGAAIAEGLAEAGARVAVNYVAGRDKAEALVKRIREQGGEAIAVAADVGREDQVKALFGATLNAFGGVDILVNNAGLQKDAPLIDMSLSDWETVIRVNLTGQFLCAREAAREFIRRGVVPDLSAAAGKIICLSSVHDVIPWAGHAWMTPEREARLLELIPYGRAGTPRDIARAAVWLASDDSDYVTGATLYVDGGMTLYPGFESGG